MGQVSTGSQLTWLAGQLEPEGMGWYQEGGLRPHSSQFPGPSTATHALGSRTRTWGRRLDPGIGCCSPRSLLSDHLTDEIPWLGRA